MDDLDLALLQAWNRLTPAIRSDRALALSRARRRLSPSYTRPIRPWCLALRASDTRLEHHAAIAPVHPSPHLNADGCPPDAAALLASLQSSSPDSPPPRLQFLLLSTNALRALTKPVFLDWPGIDLTHAAQRLGRHPTCLTTWLRSGHVKLARYNARSCGKRGYPVPFVWCPTPLDPNANLFEAPDPVWGTLWQSLHTRIPDNTELTLLRVPIDRYDYRGSRAGDGLRHNGYRFICRGLPGRPCGRQCRKLFIPLPPFTLTQALGDDPIADITFNLPPPAPRSGSEEREAGGGGSLAMPSPTVHPACNTCHKIRYFSLTSGHGWNHFITTITAGLLMGRDVARPATVKATRKRRYTPQRRTESTHETHFGVIHTKRQAQVLHAIVAGKKDREIATSLGITRPTASTYVARVLRLHGVTTRAALFARLNVQKPIPPRMALLTTLLLRGLSIRRIAAAMHLTPNGVQSGLNRLYRFHNVHSRPELLAVLRSQPIRLPARTGQPRAAA